jgi:hypothetical protein
MNRIRKQKRAKLHEARKRGYAKREAVFDAIECSRARLTENEKGAHSEPAVAPDWNLIERWLDERKGKALAVDWDYLTKELNHVNLFSLINEAGEVVESLGVQLLAQKEPTKEDEDRVRIAKRILIACPEFFYQRYFLMAVMVHSYQELTEKNVGKHEAAKVQLAEAKRKLAELNATINRPRRRAVEEIVKQADGRLKELRTTLRSVLLKNGNAKYLEPKRGEIKALSKDVRAAGFIHWKGNRTLLDKIAAELPALREEVKRSRLVHTENNLAET